VKRKPFKRSHGEGPSKPAADLVRIYGFHAVREALASPRRRGVRLFATEAAAQRLAPEIAAHNAAVTLVSIQDLSQRLGPDAVHQGVMLEASPLAPIDLDDLPDDGFVLALDQVTDPHNVGAILRTAAAFGLDAVATTERHSPAMTGVLAKSASGALEHVPIAIVPNLARGLTELGERGYFRVGLDSEASMTLGETELARPLALVLGAEGKGLRRLTRERCDVLARLDLPGPIKSLNVSNACAVALAFASQRIAPRRAPS
jgi:23S rRNA (guanosine2251-2'-O)-methyltransferase